MLRSDVVEKTTRPPISFPAEDLKPAPSRMAAAVEAHQVHMSAINRRRSVRGQQCVPSIVPLLVMQNMAKAPKSPSRLGIDEIINVFGEHVEL
jgi:hypothetical protein